LLPLKLTYEGTDITVVLHCQTEVVFVTGKEDETPAWGVTGLVQDYHR